MGLTVWAYDPIPSPTEPVPRTTVTVSGPPVTITVKETERVTFTPSPVKEQVTVKATRTVTAQPSPQATRTVTRTKTAKPQVIPGPTVTVGEDSIQVPEETGIQLPSTAPLPSPGSSQPNIVVNVPMQPVASDSTSPVTYMIIGLLFLVVLVLLPVIRRRIDRSK
jgi:cobalamin biosynthesis Mg chelatase CobN